MLEAVRSLCLAMPEAHEEAAWVGTRWRIRTKTFAHVLVIDDGWPPVYSRAVGTDGPVTVMTFRSSAEELDVLRTAGPPYFATPWRADEVGIVISEGTDWDEMRELVIESYCLQAPAKLMRLVHRPPD